jgi:ribosomal protein L11 methyltransferase
MPVVECRIEVRAGAAGAVERAMAARDDSSWAVLEDRGSGRVWVAGYFNSRAGAAGAWRRLAETIEPAWLIGAPGVRRLAETDWRESYKSHFKAWRIGRLHWVPVWERKTFAVPRRDKVVWLDPGMAFGTGNHETTRLCCRRLVAFAAAVREGRVQRRGAGRVIDAGCGSGILAISAARLGLGPVVGFDHDPDAVRVSRENAARNGMSARIRFYVADLGSGLSGCRADLVLANLQADVLRHHARELVGVIAPGGWLALGGILAPELPQVRTVFASAARGWATDSRTMGEWADLLLTRPD